MTNRRSFIKSLATVGAGLVVDRSLFASPKNTIEINQIQKSDMIWANLLHLGTNMWEDHAHIKRNSIWSEIDEDQIHKDDYECKTCEDALAWGMRGYRDFLVFDQNSWDTTLQMMSAVGMNMVIIDLGDALKYESHPEIAVKNAWTVEKLKKELQKIRKLGLEPIPKLNFATSHDSWLGEYSRMISTKKYYSVCKNLIQEVVEIFDTPRFFHIGMDEETIYHQRSYNYVVIRQKDLWWDDLYFYIDEVEKKGVRPWIWSDYGWRHPEVFFEKMPKSVLQSNWYYGSEFDESKIVEPHKTYLEFYAKLEKYGYDQVPTGSNWVDNKNMINTVKHSIKNIDASRLHGFMTAPWLPCLPLCLDKQKEAISQVGEIKKLYEQLKL